jgi:hypothetical protein
VMMVPIPARGIFEEVAGLGKALAVKGVAGIRITAERGQIVAQPPDGRGYLGFIFARGRAGTRVETSLRDALKRLDIKIRPEVPLRPVSAGRKRVAQFA